jgi:pimeloyl-ACP methyl ester carboxylesterase
MEQPVSWIIPRHPRPDYPLFVFLPGMDGSGQLYYRQIKNLAPYFDLRCLVISPQYLGDWEELSTLVIALLEQELKRQSRKVYLCGESFGGCLALKIATKSAKLIKKLILINPASSFNLGNRYHPDDARFHPRQLGTNYFTLSGRSGSNIPGRSPLSPQSHAIRPTEDD